MSFRNRKPPEQVVPAVEVSDELAHARRTALSLVLVLRERDEQIAELRKQIEANTAEVAAVRRDVAGLPREFDRSIVKEALQFVNDRALAQQSAVEQNESHPPIGALWASLDNRPGKRNDA